MANRFLTLVLLLFLLLHGVGTRAQNISETRSATDQALDVDGARSEVDLSGATERVQDLADALDQTPSTVVQRSGGLGSATYLSIRGADPSHVRIVLDGVPLHGAQGSAFDLSSIPTTLLGHVTVYRSNVPLQLGAPLPGGLVHLQTRFDSTDSLHLYASAGSLGARRVGAAYQQEKAHGQLLLAASYQGANNRFSYFDDRGTPFNDQDDGFERRENAGTDAGHLLARHRVRVGPWRLTTIGLFGADHQGLPGPTIDPARSTSLQRTRLFGALRAERARWLHDDVDLELLAGGSWLGQRYRDRDDELGLGAQDQRDHAELGLVGARPTAYVGQHLTIRGVLDALGEGYGSRAASASSNDVAASRMTLAAGLETEVSAWRDRLRLNVGTRVDWAMDRARVGDETDRTNRWLPTPQAGIALVPWDDTPWQLRWVASVGLAARAPSFFELYGDRGATVGNPGLNAERRRGVDLGTQLDGRLQGRASAHLQLTYGYFDRRVSDLIQFIDNGLGVSTPINIGQASIRGHEVAGRLSIGPGDEATTRWDVGLTVSGTYANIAATDRTAGAPSEGAAIPGRPRHQYALSVRPHVAWASLAYALDGNGATTLDRRGRRPIPRRMEHGVSLTLRPPLAWSPTLAFEVHNLADTRIAAVSLPDGGTSREVPRAVADVTGYPLVGRTFFVTLTVRGTP